MRKALVNARHVAKMTQREVAKQINVSERFYQSLESGTATGKIERWFELARMFNKPVEDLLKKE